jgi:hypothetical protein
MIFKILIEACLIKTTFADEAQAIFTHLQYLTASPAARLYAHSNPTPDYSHHAQWLVSYPSYTSPQTSPQQPDASYTYYPTKPNPPCHSTRFPPNTAAALHVHTTYPVKLLIPLDPYLGYDVREPQCIDSSGQMARGSGLGDVGSLGGLPG